MIEKLEELGLLENEAKIYLALLELGTSTTGPLIKKTNIYRVMVYDILNKLLNKGLVSYFKKNNIKYFSAVNPSRIVEIQKQKQETASEILPLLKRLRKEEDLRDAQIYTSWQGIKAAQGNYLKEMKKDNSGEYLMVGASKVLHKKLDAFFNYFHEQRSKLKVPAKLLFNENNKRYGNLKKKYKPVQVRFMDIVTPSWVSTYNDLVLIGVAGNYSMAISVRNKEIAESYREYFSFMWKNCK